MITILINSVDFSNHVVKCDKIPVCVRNRDFSPVAEGFGFSLGWNVAEVPEAGDVVIVKYDTTKIYHGYLTKVTTNHNESTYDMEVENSILKLREILIESSKLRRRIVQTNDYETGTAFEIVEGQCYSPSHGLSTDQAVLIMSDGTLPTPLRDDRYYYAFYESSDHFRLRLKPDDLGYVDITTAGVGTHKFIVPDLNLYNEIDNAECPNANLAWVLKNIFIAAGLKLDTSDVDEVVLVTISVSGIGTDYKFKEMKIDLNMLFAINQDYAFNNTKIDDTDGYTYFQNKVVALEFVFWLCSMFGFTLVFSTDTGGITYKLKAPSSYIYTITDDKKFAYSYELVPAETVSGYSCLMKYNTDRTKYLNNVETDISEINIITAGNSEHEIEWYSNFMLLFKDKQVGAQPGNVLSMIDYPYPETTALQMKKRWIEYEHLKEEITTEILLSNPFVLENYIDPEKLTSSVTQENIT